MTDDETRALGAVLTRDVPDLKGPPDRLGRIAERVRSRRRRQVAGTCAGVIAVTVVAVASFPMLSAALKHDESSIAAPTATSITSVDWTRATLDLPSNRATPCPTGRQRLEPKNELRYGRVGEVSDDTKAGRRTFQILNSPKTLGDLTGDGRSEALLHVRCSGFPAGEIGEEEGAQLLAVTMRADHTLVGLGYVGQVHAQYPSYRITDGQVVAQLRYAVINRSQRGFTRYDLAHVRKYSWNGRGFVQVAGRTQPLVLSPIKDGVSSPVRLSAILRGNTTVCPAATVTFRFGEATSGRYTYSIEGRGNGQIVDLDKDGNDEMLVAVRCRGNGYDATSLYLLGQGTETFVARDVPLANDGTYTIQEAQFRGTALRLQVTVKGVARTITMPWDGKGFPTRVGRSTAGR